MVFYPSVRQGTPEDAAGFDIGAPGCGWKAQPLRSTFLSPERPATTGVYTQLPDQTIRKIALNAKTTQLLARLCVAHSREPPGSTAQVAFMVSSVSFQSHLSSLRSLVAQDMMALFVDRNRKQERVGILSNISSHSLSAIKSRAVELIQKR